MGWRVAAAEKKSIKGVISPDTDLKKNRIPRLLQNTREFCKIPYNSTHESPAKIRMTFAGLILRQDIYLFPAILNFSYSSPSLYNETSIRGVIRYFSI